MKRIKIGDSYLELMVGDITKQETEAIVNAANKRLAPGGGVAGAIHTAAGPKLWEECKKLEGCETGEAKITNGYNLPTHYVIHTVGPVYSRSPEDPIKLASCYSKSLMLASVNKIKSIAFPALSTGYFGYPIDKAAKIALKTLTEELKKKMTIDLVRIVLYNSKSLKIYEKILESINIK